MPSVVGDRYLDGGSGDQDLDSDGDGDLRGGEGVRMGSLMLVTRVLGCRGGRGGGGGGVGTDRGGGGS